MSEEGKGAKRTKRIDGEEKAAEKQKRLKNKEAEWGEILKKEREEGEEEKEEVPSSKGDEREEVKKKKPSKGSTLGSFSGTTLLVAIGAIILISIVVTRLFVPILAPTLTAFNDWKSEVVNSLNYIDGRVDSVNASVPDTSNYVTFSTYNEGVTSFNQRLDGVEEVAVSASSDINYLNTYIANQIESPMEYRVSGLFGNYTLTIRVSETGNYTARVNCLYQPAIGVGTVNSTLGNVTMEFYNTWITTRDKDYTPYFVYDTQWAVSRVTFHSGKFGVVASNWTTRKITFTGLNVTPSQTYVEVFKVG